MCSVPAALMAASLYAAHPHPGSTLPCLLLRHVGRKRLHPADVKMEALFLRCWLTETCSGPDAGAPPSSREESGSWAGPAAPPSLPASPAWLALIAAVC